MIDPVIANLITSAKESEMLLKGVMPSVNELAARVAKLEQQMARNSQAEINIEQERRASLAKLEEERNKR